MKIATLVMATSLALTGSALAQDPTEAKKETDRNPQTGKEIKDAQRTGKFKAGKALADTVKATAQDPDFRDEDSDDDGVGDVARAEAHELSHSVQQKEGADATADTGDKPKKADKKKGDNN